MSGFKRVKRIIQVNCRECWGTGKAVGEPCRTCKGKGEVDTVVWEIVADDNEAVPS